MLTNINDERTTTSGPSSPVAGINVDNNQLIPIVTGSFGGLLVVVGYSILITAVLCLIIFIKMKKDKEVSKPIFVVPSQEPKI